MNKWTIALPTHNEPIKNALHQLSTVFPMLDENEINDLYEHICQDEVLDPELEKHYHTNVFPDCFQYYNPDTKLPFLFAPSVEMFTKTNYPEPSRYIRYTEQDIIDACAKWKSREIDLTINHMDNLYANFAGYIKARTLAIPIKNKDQAREMIDYIKRLKNQTTNLDPEASDMINRFLKTDIDNFDEPVTTFFLHESYQTELYYLITKYLVDHKKALFPFTLDQWLHPTSISFINLETTAQSEPSIIRQQWNAINKAEKVKTFTQKEIRSAQDTDRQIDTSMYPTMYQPSIDIAVKVNRYHFDINQFTPQKCAQRLRFILKKMQQQNKSDYVMKRQRKSFMRANRREPNNLNAQGKLDKNIYYPDIHIYCDTSGSISQDQYASAIKTCIHIAKELNTDLYFHSFSHILSTPSKIETKGLSEKQAFKRFEKVAKVTGGTNFEQVWHYIQENKQRRNELSIMITDFQWTPSQHNAVTHPKHLYYIPCELTSCENDAKRFAQAMVHIKPNIRKHILF